MSSKRTSRTTRRLIKLASLGIAGLLAGLLAGCFDAPKTVSANSNTDSSEQLSSPASTIPPSLDATSIPSIKHPPSARRLHYGTVHASRQAAHYPDRS